MPAQALSCGTSFTLLNGVIYAAPSVKANLYTDTPVAVSLSNVPNFSSNGNPVPVNGSYPLAGAYVRVNADALVTIKRA